MSRTRWAADRPPTGWPTDGLPTDALDQVRETLGAAVAVAGRLKGQAGDQMLDAAREAFTHGMRIACGAGALVLVAAAVLALVTLRRVGPTGPTPGGTPPIGGDGTAADGKETAGRETVPSH